MKKTTNTVLILAFFVLTAGLFYADFNPNVKTIEGKLKIFYSFCGTELTLANTIKGTPTALRFVIKSRDHTENGNNFVTDEYNQYLRVNKGKPRSQTLHSLNQNGSGGEDHFIQIIKKGENKPLEKIDSGRRNCVQSDLTKHCCTNNTNNVVRKWPTSCNFNNNFYKNSIYFTTVTDFPYNFTVPDQRYKTISFTPKFTPMMKWDYISEGFVLRNRTWDEWDNMIVEDQYQNISIPMWAQKTINF